MFNKVRDCTADGAVSDLLEQNVKKMLLGVLHRGLPEVVKSGRHFLAAESVEQKPETVVSHGHRIGKKGLTNIEHRLGSPERIQ